MRLWLPDDPSGLGGNGRQFGNGDLPAPPAARQQVRVAEPPVDSALDGVVAVWPERAKPHVAEHRTVAAGLVATVSVATTVLVSGSGPVMRTGSGSERALGHEVLG